VRRREFIAIIGGGAVWPLATRAQDLRAVGKIGFLYPGPEAHAKSRSVPFLAGLASEGLHEPDQITLLIRATGGGRADRAAFERPSRPQD
jgi:putative tryptophan/tyrosine transport system substrate-binding protein